MNIKCIVIDDEPLAIKVLEQHILKVPDLELVATFQSPIEAIEVLKDSDISLLFLDIQMPVLTGIDFVKTTNLNAKVVFTTAYRDYAIESFELDVIDYLLKPISFTRFFKAINKYKQTTFVSKEALSSINPIETDNHIYVNSNKKYIKIDFDQILYIESIKDYIRIHTTGNAIITKDKISAFEEKLPATFLRIHRSYIVNKINITAFTAKDVEIGKIEVPIGERYKAEVLESLKS